VVGSVLVLISARDGLITTIDHGDRSVWSFESNFREFVKRAL